MRSRSKRTAKNAQRKKGTTDNAPRKEETAKDPRLAKWPLAKLLADVHLSILTPALRTTMVAKTVTGRIYIARVSTSFDKSIAKAKLLRANQNTRVRLPITAASFNDDGLIQAYRVWADESGGIRRHYIDLGY